MANEDKNYVSVWFWLLSFVVMIVPVVNIIMALIWAFAGQNQSRKNYFRAIILVWMLFVGLAVLFGFVFGLRPEAVQKFKTLGF